MERRVEAGVIRRVIAHDVDHRCARAPRVVQVREAVAQSGPEVEQRRGRLVRHAGVAVGGARWRHPRRGKHPRISGTSSSAATKCISEVPGVLKHV